MATVTGTVRTAKQPRGGYIKVADMDHIQLSDEKALADKENLTPGLVGTVVDYLTRYVTGTETTFAFGPAVNGFYRAEDFGLIEDFDLLIDYILAIESEDKTTSVIAACKLASYDIWTRNLFAAASAKKDNEINPDENTVRNIQIMVERSKALLDSYGGVVTSGFTFEPKSKNKAAYRKMLTEKKGSYGGYTYKVTSGDGDYLTQDTLWDFKVSKTAPTSKSTLQILMYWIMGQHSRREEFKAITHLGIFNPRLNDVYRIAIADIPIDTIKAVEMDILGYNRSLFKTK